MLSSFDDFPIHQTAHPVARTASTDINHYDRYFFNGMTADTSLFFAVAMGLYPNRHVADASFSVVVGGGTDDAHQISVHASRRAPLDRADANDVGPISVEVVEPLRVLRVRVDAPEHGLAADLTFTGRAAPIEEPHFRHQVGVRVLLDFTRLTQFGTWDGWVDVDGQRTEVGASWGCRDRSWGVRPVGERATTGAPVADPQFFWLWAPINFEGFATHFDVNELTDGTRWHQVGLIAPCAAAGAPGQAGPGSSSAATAPADAEPPEIVREIDYRLTWRDGTRAVETFELQFVPSVGEPSHIVVEPLFDVHMLGLGYGHPEWGHGMWKGELAVAGERWSLPVDDPVAPQHVHIQTVVRARTTGALGEHDGLGVLEQLAVGRHVPTGLEGVFDGFAGPDDV